MGCFVDASAILLEDTSHDAFGSSTSPSAPGTARSHLAAFARLGWFRGRAPVSPRTACARSCCEGCALGGRSGGVCADSPRGRCDDLHRRPSRRGGVVFHWNISGWASLSGDGVLPGSKCRRAGAANALGCGSRARRRDQAVRRRRNAAPQWLCSSRYQARECHVRFLLLPGVG